MSYTVGVETRRSLRSGLFDVAHRIPTSPISITAALSLGVLVLVSAWSMTRQVDAGAPTPVAQTTAALGSGASLPQIGTATNVAPTDLSNFAPQVVGLLATEYAQMQKDGSYTPEAAAAAAQGIAPAIKAPVTYKTFSIADLKTTQDTSYAGMQRYQSELRSALAPLSKNTTPEISIFALYTQTGDQKYLDELRAVAGEYQNAASSAAAVEVPQDAVAYHIGILNAMEEFAATLSALAQNASDPITTMALLNTYNGAEADMVSSFDGFASYVQNHS